MGRILTVAAGLCIAAILIWRPAAPAPPASQPLGAPRPARSHRLTATPGADPVVYVAGAVAHPGLYRVDRGARAADAVRRAGGLRSDADVGGINLAAHVSDGDEVFAPVLGQPTPRAARRRPVRRTTKKTTTRVVNVNADAATELALVPGIGATLAARIVDARERDGAFTSLDQLLDVAGMTAARLARAEPYLQI
jgi:competence protein ComEA